MSGSCFVCGGSSAPVSAELVNPATGEVLLTVFLCSFECVSEFAGLIPEEPESERLYSSTSLGVVARKGLGEDNND